MKRTKPLTRLPGQLVTWSLLLVGSGLPAQTPSETWPGKVFTNKAQFRLPLKLSEADRLEIQEVRLYARSLAEGWSLKETASPAQTFFSYSAARDEEYWFTVVTVDKTGKATPADVSRATPGLIVVVDTQAPEIHLSLTPPTMAAAKRTIRCEVRDANADPRSVKVEYQTAGKTWRLLEVVPGSQELFQDREEQPWTGLVRATAADRAGNTATAEINFSTSTSAARAPLTLISATIPPVPEPSPRSPESLRRQLLGSTHVTLEYQIEQQGPSGVSKVEVWLTRDEAQTWQRLCEDSDRRSPVDFDLPGEGLFGISLVLTNGTGIGGTPPSKGETPDYWLEIDQTKPVARLLPVRPGTGEEAGTLLITWIASDENLGPDAIDLFYATRRDGSWLPLAKGIKNEGIFRWPVPRDAGQEFYVRLDVTDRAGNTTRCESPQPLVLDLARPKARVLGAASGAPRSAPPGGN